MVLKQLRYLRDKLLIMNKIILKISKISLILLLIIGFYFRFNQIAFVPPSPSLDEVSIGYNAYSILNTGMDEYGKKFPILLRAYDDLRPALYTYLVIPFVAVFD